MQNAALSEIRPVYPTCQQFAEQIGSGFAVSVSDAAPVQLELTQVSSYGGLDVKDKSLKIQAFAITFTGARTPQLPQGSYAMAHPALGSLDIFIVPIGTDSRGVRYEAIFNFN